MKPTKSQKLLDGLISTTTPPKKIPTTEYLPEGLFPIVDQSQNYVAGWTNDDEAVIKDEFPLIVFGDHTCVLKLVNQPFAQGADGIKILKAKLGVRTDYLYQFLQFNPVVTEEYKRHFSILKNKKITYPDKKFGEQKKIADCLSSLDELIAAQTRKLGTLKAHKKGLMQQLFPLDGETVPKLRFPEFRNKRVWQQQKAGTLFKNRIEEGEAELPIYSVTMNGGMVRRSSLDRHIDDISEPGSNKKAFKNDIAYNMMRMWQGAFGVAIENCMVSPAYVVLAPQDEVFSDFFAYLLKTPRYLQLLTIYSQGLTLDRLRLYYKDFAQISLICPTFPEQQKIADCLSFLDELIAAQTQKLDTLKAHKKGLMQQLFPSVDEVQG